MKKIIPLVVALALSSHVGVGATSLVPWGSSRSGQNQVPAGLRDVVAIAEGSDFSLGLKDDGTVASWGRHWNGYTYVPMTAPAELRNVVAIAAGYDFSLALKEDGSVVAWGENVLGQSDVPPGLTDVVAIAAGYNHSLALQSDGVVVAWGYNSSGQTTVPEGLTDVVAIAAGLFHSLALRSDGTVVAWGRDCQLQSVAVPAGLGNVVAISAGCAHSLALKSDGTVVAWGENFSGQLHVPARLSNVVAIAAGETHSLALKADGRVVAWGADSLGQSAVPAGLMNVVAIAGGWEHSLALVGEANPAIAIQPSDQMVRASSGALFRIVSTGRAPLKYQWQFNGANLPGATNSWLSLKSAGVSDTGTYRVLVSNALGTATSEAATLTVCDFTVSPTNAAFNYQGGSTNINVAASSGACPWTVENPNDWVVVQPGTDGLGSGSFHCLVAANRTAASRSGILTVEGRMITLEQAGVPHELLPQITRQPKGKTLKKPGEKADLHVGVKKHPKMIRPITYQWYFNGAAIPGATRAKLMLKGEASQSGDYHVVVSSPFGDVTSATAAIGFRTDLIDPRLARLERVSRVRSGPVDDSSNQSGQTTMPVVRPTILGYGLSPDGRLVLTWSPEGLKLQRTTDLGTPDWQDVPNSENSATAILPMTDKAGFFRLIKP